MDKAIDKAIDNRKQNYNYFSKYESSFNTELRDYQRICVNQIIYYLDSDSTAVMLECPTGGGKTAMLSASLLYIRENVDYVVIIAHTIELIKQIAIEVEKHTGLKPHLHITGAAFLELGDCNIHVCMVRYAPTLMKNLKYTKGGKLTIGLAIDETHHACAKTYKDAIGHADLLIGLTATPFRLDKNDCLNSLYLNRVNAPNMKALVELKHLKTPEIITSQVIIDMIRSGEWKGEKLQLTNGQIVVEFELLQSRTGLILRAIFYCVNIEEAIDLTNKLNQKGITAEFISGKTPKAEREDIISRFKDGSLQCLTNVNIFTEGFDLPDVDCVVFGRDTESLVLFIQAMGRCLRPSPGKEKGYIIDGGSNTYRFMESEQIVSFDWCNFTALQLTVNVKEAEVESEEDKKMKRAKVGLQKAHTIASGLSDVIIKKNSDWQGVLADIENQLRDYKRGSKRLKYPLYKTNGKILGLLYSLEFIAGFISLSDRIVWLERFSKAMGYKPTAYTYKYRSFSSIISDLRIGGTVDHLLVDSAIGLFTESEQNYNSSYNSIANTYPAALTTLNATDNV